jgi:hypothetical protein
MARFGVVIETYHRPLSRPQPLFVQQRPMLLYLSLLSII